MNNYSLKDLIIGFIVAWVICSAMYGYSMYSTIQADNLRYRELKLACLDTIDGWQECVEVLGLCATTLEDCIIETEPVGLPVVHEI